MADVFISYSKKDKPIAESLGEYLKAQGLSVWWDSSLVAGENYRDKIAREMAAADTVLVIWTANSVKSEWVISEAERAASHNKLFPLRTPDVELSQIPQPFDTRHTPILDMEGGSIPRPSKRYSPALQEAAAIALSIMVFVSAAAAYFRLTQDANLLNLPLYFFLAIFSYLFSRMLVWIVAAVSSRSAGLPPVGKIKPNAVLASQILERK